MIILVVILVVAVAYWALLSSRSQLFGAFPYRHQTDNKVVALSFDDGPNQPYTTEILDFLNRQGIKATFFQVGKNVQRFPKVTKRLHDSGHIIGNHSYSHRFINYFRPGRMDDEVKKTQDIIHGVIGQTPALFRPPWLYRQPSLFRTVSRLGLRPISGIFCSPYEVFQLSAAGIAKRALAKAKPGTILIFHDGYNAKGGKRAQTVEAVKQTIGALKEQNYSFVTVSQLLDIPAYKKAD